MPEAYKSLFRNAKIAKVAAGRHVTNVTGGDMKNVTIAMDRESKQ